ncbi:hypothetical protein ACFQPA_10675 [Halomarina halobia]|uniref:Transporter n=1 Tax=Halomarina halobia TaxID=3033386 RepID=A0ABD6AC14_9EURY|nr:hypothetical protein [Halomarina sp. PSR21]
MALEREALVEIVVSVAAVGLFIAVIVGIGVTYNGSTGLSNEGAFALVGSIAGFVIVMSLLGYALSRR